MNANDFWTLNLLGVADLIRDRQVSPVEVASALLARIERIDGKLHGYVTVCADTAMAQARAAEQEIARGEYRGALHGVPLALKDLCATKGIRTTCASPVLADWIPDHDATVARKLAASGAVLLGKLNMTEFAMSGYHPSLPIPLNPWNPEYYPGGSSSGSGVATAAGLCFGSIGTDTGGSIRFPAACCGVVGLKPTYGRVSRHGVFPLAESLDHVGPLARSVGDAAVLLDAIAGFDPDDPTTARRPQPRCCNDIGRDIEGIRIGLDERYVSHAVQAEVASATLEAARIMTSLGAEIVEVSAPSVEEALRAWPTLCASEALLAHEGTFPSRASEYGPMFRSFLEQGQSLSGRDYAQAHTVRLAYSGRLQVAFDGIDVMICPAMPILPPPASFIDPYAPLRTEDLGFMRFTAPFDMSGSPTICLPGGFSPNRLPHSVQFVGRHFDEALLCRVADAFERATEWHRRRPPLSA
jgi:amidase